MGRLHTFIFTFSCAFFFFAFVFHGEVVVNKSQAPVVLGNMTYDYGGVSAPVATGSMLTLQSWILTSSFFGPFLRRVLLNDNKLHMLRELAKQIPYVAPLHFPMRRLSSESHGFHTEAAASGAEALQAAMMGSPEADGAFSDSRVMAFHRAYTANDGNTPSVVIRRILKSLDGENGLQAKYRVFVSINKEDVMRQAQASSERYANGSPLSILDGVPVAVKDMIDVLGHVMKDGSASHEDELPAAQDDPLVANLRKLGAIIMGTTTMTEGGVTPLGYCVAEQGPFNAFDVHHYSGGSSSGSAVAVALGIAPITIGFDGGGSIRIPSSFNGAVGLATTFGRLGFEKRHGSTMIKGGPIAATVDDAAIGYIAMGAAPPDHLYGQMYGAMGVPPVHLSTYPLKEVTVSGKPLQGLKVGVFEDHFNDGDEVVVEACKAAVARLESLGATIVPVTFPNMGWFRLAHAIKISTEFAMAWDTSYYDGIAGSLLEANTRITAGLGTTVSAKEAMAADKLRRYAFNYITQVFADQVDVIVSPTLPMLPPALPQDALSKGESNVPLVIEMMKHIFQANLMGLPALTLPIPPSTKATHLPIGFQLLGDHWSEAKLLSIAKTLEQTATCPNKSPDYFDAISSTSTL